MQKKRTYVEGRTYKQWCEDNREHLREKGREYHKKYYSDPEKHKMEVARRKRWADAHKDQVSAMQKINRYIKNGMVRRRECEVCGDENTHAHHDDYTRPLSVRWLCPIHHSEWHKNNTPKRGPIDEYNTTIDRAKIRTGWFK